MTKEELKNKYSAFITEISEILGLGKPVDILKLCATTDLFFQPLEKRIAELEAQIEKMKCCQNCKYYSWCPKDCSKNEPCEGYNKWELKEIKEK